MESPAVLLLKVKTPEAGLAILTPLVDEHTGAESVTHEASYGGHQAYALDAVDHDRALALVKAACSKAKVWALIDDEPVRSLVVTERKKAKVETWEPDIDEGLLDRFDLLQWFLEDLPENARAAFLGEGLPPSPKTKRLVEKIYDARCDAKPIAKLVEQLRAVEDISFIEDRNEDVLDLVYCWHVTEEVEDSLALLRAAVDAGYDLNRATAGQSLFDRVFDATNRELDGPLWQRDLPPDEAQKKRQAIVDHAAAVLALAVELGADPNLVFDRKEQRMLRAERVSSFDPLWQVPLLFVLSENWQAQPAMYAPLIPAFSAQSRAFIEQYAQQLTGDEEVYLPVEVLEALRALDA